ncbi:hypothetical protein V8F20_003136 [Naviculisporaceae sp. PSN 640]
MEAMDIKDAVELGLLLPDSHSRFTSALLHSPESVPSFEWRLSTFRNPFHYLTILLYRLSNNKGIFGELRLMDECFQQMQESMLKMLFAVDSPSIRAAWGDFLSWTVWIDNHSLFSWLAKIVLQSRSYAPGSGMLSKLLCFAAWFGNADLCRDLISQDAPLDDENKFEARFKLSAVSIWYCPLAAAAVRGKISIVELLLRAGARVNSDPRETNRHGPVMESAAKHLLLSFKRDNNYRKDRLRIMDILLAAGFEPGLLAKRLCPRPSMYANKESDCFIEDVFRYSQVTSTSRNLASYIMENYAGKDVEEKLIHACFQNNRHEAWRFIVDYVRKTNHIDKVLMIALAARANNLDAITVLQDEAFDSPPTPGSRPSYGCYSVLLLSSGTFDVTVSALRILARLSPATDNTLEFLVQKGADVASCQPKFWSKECWVEGTPLMWLLRNGVLDHGPTSVYSLLRPAMWRRQIHYDRNRTLRRKVSEIAHWLHDRAIPVFSPQEASLFKWNQKIEINLHPLSVFIDVGCRPEIIDCVLESGISINTGGKDPESYTPLETAVHRTDTVSLSKLIARGAKIDAGEEAQRPTALQLACNCQCSIDYPCDTKLMMKTVEILLKAGADPNLRTKGCNPPLAIVRHVDLLKLLLAYGADANDSIFGSGKCGHRGLRKCNSGYLSWPQEVSVPISVLSFFLLIRLRSRIRLVRELLKRGARITADDLRLACLAGNLDLVKLLLDWGADPNGFSPRNGPALSEAVWQGNLPMILLLLAAGAAVDPEVDDLAKSPLVEAATWGRLDVVALFKQYEIRAHVIERAISAAHDRQHYEVALQLHHLLQKRNSEATGMAG